MTRKRNHHNVLKASITLLMLVFTFPTAKAEGADTLLIRKHLTALTKSGDFRTYENLNVLKVTASYIHHQFELYSSEVEYQEFTVAADDPKEHTRTAYNNVICFFGPKDAERIVIGAHYDVCDEQEGADDNASGITGLLELARLLEGKKLKYRIELVAYCLEEPPFFRTEEMGSYYHARNLSQEQVPVKGMISLEMIGYFDDDKGSQEYPAKILKLFYGGKGNYITMVRKFGSGRFSRVFARKYKHKADIRTKRFVAPAALPGIDFSDHLNYWEFGMSALMITDTAFYRNKEYHMKGDTMDRLDFDRMAQVIDGVLSTILRIR